MGTGDVRGAMGVSFINQLQLLLIGDNISKRELQLIDKRYSQLVSDTEVYSALFSLGFVQYLFEN